MASATSAITGYACCCTAASDGRLTKPRDCEAAIHAWWRRALKLNDRFTATGEIRLLGAHIGGRLDLSGATLINPDGLALNLQELRASALMLRNFTKPPAL